MKRYFLILGLLATSLFLVTCQKFEIITKLITIDATATGALTATAQGKIIELSSAGHSQYGFVFSTAAYPTIADGKLELGSPKDGDFIGNITGLTKSTQYYLRSFCSEGDSYLYGEQKTFTTTDGMPLLTTTEVTAITTTAAASGGNISSDGGSAITARGVCWATTASPTTSNSKTTNGSGIGTWESELVELTINTTYYVRAYATNSMGTVYGNEVNFSTLMPDGPGSPITDNDGNTYNTVWIDGKLWMAENLKTTKYNNGTAINNITDNAAWKTDTSGAYCWYNNDIANKATYGGLYNWHTINTAKLAPAGWHVPTDAEWTQLTDYLGGEAFAGGKMKATILWDLPNTGATNISGFTALPGGCRYGSIGEFAYLGSEGHWWSSTADGASNAWERLLSYYFADAYRGNYPSSKLYGFSVRCVRD